MTISAQIHLMLQRLRSFCAGMAALAASPFAAVAAGDVALGEYLSATCVTCHQKSGASAGGVPPIVGWPADQFVAVMSAYRSKERENEVMRSLAMGLSMDDIAALAAYFEGLKPEK